jgi:hypothetical protein
MRPREKEDAQRIALTLSRPAREWLDSEHKRLRVSRTKVVEDLIDREVILREEIEAQKKTLNIARPVQCLDAKKKSSN